MTSASTPALHARPARRRILLLALALVLLAIIGGGLYYRTRPLPTHLSESLSSPSAAPGEALQVRGVVEPVSSVRRVALQTKTNGAWQTSSTTTTDSTGGYGFTYIPVASAEKSVFLRILVAKDGRLRAAKGHPLLLKLLANSTATVNAPATWPRGTPFELRGTVLPSGPGRTVTASQSGDGNTWVPFATTATTGSDGSFVLHIATPQAGTLKYRAVVGKDDSYGLATSNLVSVTVEDIKAAGAYYLQATSAANTAGMAFYKDASDYYVGLTQLQAVARRLASADRTFADQLSGYTAWPKAVQPLIDELVREVINTYDLLNQAANAQDISSFDALKGRVGDALKATTPAAIRQALGLGARPVS